MAKTLTLPEVTTRFPKLGSGVQEREEEVVVTKTGRPAPVLVNVNEYARLNRSMIRINSVGSVVTRHS